MDATTPLSLRARPRKPRGRHDDDGDAVGEAKKRRDVGSEAHDAVDPFGANGANPLDLGGAILRGDVVDDGEIVAVDLVGHDDGHVRRAENAHEKRTVLLDDARIVPDVACEVETR